MSYAPRAVPVRRVRRRPTLPVRPARTYAMLRPWLTAPARAPTTSRAPVSSGGLTSPQGQGW